MLSAHCIHNQKPTGLKYHVYKEFGDIGYDDDADPYLKASKEEEDKHGANAINRIDQAPLDKLLVYNALDSLYTYKLFELHRNRLDEFQMEGFRFFVESSVTFAKATQNGLGVDKDALDNAYVELDKKMSDLEKDIYDDPDVQKWDGSSKFNYSSSTQLSHLLFDILKIKPLSYTGSGQPSVDKEVLPKYAEKVPFINKLLEYRKWAKIHDTYLSQYRSEIIDGQMHAYTNLNRVDTYRTSMSDVNLQNIPKRDKEVKKLLRSS